MANRILTAICAVITFFSITPMAAQIDSLKLATAQLLVDLNKAVKGDGSAAREIIKNRQSAVRQYPEVYDQFITGLFKAHQYEIAHEVMQVNPFLPSQPDEQALYFYYKGVAQMLSKRGWPYFKEAEKSLHQATKYYMRSYVPDYGFFSDLENAKGYLSITARGLSASSRTPKVCIVRPEFMYQAIEHFRTALMFNPDNTYAQTNLDTLILKLKEADLSIPPPSYSISTLAGANISLDSVNADSLNTFSIEPLLNYNLLPKNYAFILRQIQPYDEILILFDLSGSMEDAVEWSAEASKFKIAQALSLYIAINLKKTVFLGALSVGQQCDNTKIVLNHPIASIQRQALTTKFTDIHPYGWTPLNRRLRHVSGMFSNRNNKKLVFLLSDGMDSCNEIVDLCGTAAELASMGIDLSIFSFIYEAFDAESRSAYAVYDCMVRPSNGKIYRVDEIGIVDDEIEFKPISNNVLLLPQLDTSILWTNNPGTYQFDIPYVEPPLEKILTIPAKKPNGN